jgi:hypothetical protein
MDERGTGWFLVQRRKSELKARPERLEKLMLAKDTLAQR